MRARRGLSVSCIFEHSTDQTQKNLELQHDCGVIPYEKDAYRVGRPAAKDKLSDAELLRLCKGDEEAFLTLYRRHQGSVFRFALHMSGKQETAEEVTQEVFLALFWPTVAIRK